MEIKVVVPDPLAASDLTWFLDASARVIKNPDGVCVVHVEAGPNPRYVLAEIKKWLRLNDIGGVVVHVDEGSELLAPEP